MRRLFPALLAVAIAGTTLGPAAAQNNTPQPGDPQRQVPETSCAAASNNERDQTTLSDKLAQSKGVICPPERLDSAIRKAPPAGGSIEVIPPPGSPGGDPTVQPK